MAVRRPWERSNLTRENETSWWDDARISFLTGVKLILWRAYDEISWWRHYGLHEPSKLIKCCSSLETFMQTCFYINHPDKYIKGQTNLYKYSFLLLIYVWQAMEKGWHEWSKIFRFQKWQKCYQSCISSALRFSGFFLQKSEETLELVLCLSSL